ncbi:CPBP family intramembrane metalloprotease [Rhodoferax sp. AJA081-3]|uniref:CPBP family intramembrane glutamic endopeptidase n=1 Tax=Rhodoferax sp. AJA081-3 TaxID=2752316 RepID=UPI001ADEC4D2|nr:CPBP family intramembrane glutamic endopeptidase [Rhodoferax sp. AJA081-3]QTN30036.1 CPBP family intramembrane metalloprotease [Rhodoferax sp. AJA081-3]
MPLEKTTFPSASQAALLLLSGFLLQYLLGAALYDIRRSLDITDEQGQVLVMLLANGILITAVMHVRGMSHRDLVHPSHNSLLLTSVFLVPPVLLLIPLTVLLDLVLIDSLEAVFPVSAWEQQAFSNMLAATLPAVVATCVIAPIVEEMLFRGILLRSFLEQYPRGVAIGFSALYFGAAHLNIYQFLLAFLLGLLLGWLYERSSSLVPCIALHAAVNGSVVLLETSKDSVTSLDPFAFPAIAWLGAIIAATVGATVLFRLLGIGANKGANET